MVIKIKTEIDCDIDLIKCERNMQTEYCQNDNFVRYCHR